MTTQFWFHVEPYVHLSCKSDDCLLYNTLSGKALIYWNDPPVAGLVRRLLSPKNSRVIRLSISDLEKKKVSDFIKRLRGHFMGDLLDAAYSSAHPVQMFHRPKIQKDAGRLKKEQERSVGEGALEYLSEVSFYINTECVENCPGCGDYSRQFLNCTRPVHGNHEITSSTLSGLLSQIEGSPLSRINILGGNIFLHSQIRILAEILRTRAGEIAFYLHYSHLNGTDSRMDFLDFDAARYKILLTPPYSPDLFSAARDQVSGYESRTTFIFIVQGDEDIQQAQDMIETGGIASYTLRPYFNGGNDAFFRESVLMELEDILNARPTHKEIYANQVLNRLNFGRLTVMSNGKVYANLNNPSLGTLGKDSILQMLYREMDHGKSWLRTRPKVEPCRHCVLSALCPPLGNYEFALNRNDLCQVREEKDELRVTKISSA